MLHLPVQQAAAHYEQQAASKQQTSRCWPHSRCFQAHLGLLKRLLQDAVHVLVNLVQLVLLDVALLQQALGVLLVRVLVRSDGLHSNTSYRRGHTSTHTTSTFLKTRRA